jgi:hypothetical protein
MATANVHRKKSATEELTTRLCDMIEEQAATGDERQFKRTAKAVKKFLTKAPASRASS